MCDSRVRKHFVYLYEKMVILPLKSEISIISTDWKW